MCKPDDHRYRPNGRGGKPAALLSLIGLIERAATEATSAVETGTGSLIKTGADAQHASVGGDKTIRKDSSKPCEAIVENSNHAEELCSSNKRKSPTEEEAEVHSLTNSDPASTDDEDPPYTIETRGKRRRRPPLNPVTREDETQKGHKRVYVHHNYHDYSRDRSIMNPMRHPHIPVIETKGGMRGKTSGGVTSPFPAVLHNMLERAEAEGYARIVSWQSHGRAFHVHDQSRFVSEVMPLYFRQTRFSSFQRQLSLYGFLRLTRKDKDHGAYYHEFFLRGLPRLCGHMQRTRIKGYWVRQASSPETEPDFYSMPYVKETLTDDEMDCSQDCVEDCSQDPFEKDCLPKPSEDVAKVPSRDTPSEASSIASFEVDDDAPITSFERQEIMASIAFAAPDFTAASRLALLSPPQPRVSSADYMKLEPIQSAGSALSNSSEVTSQSLLLATLNGFGEDISQDEQNDMAAFLSDVDLESDNEDGDLYQQEEIMEMIYSNDAARQKQAKSDE